MGGGAETSGGAGTTALWMSTVIKGAKRLSAYLKKQGTRFHGDLRGSATARGPAGSTPVLKVE